jgi:nucleoside-diphosphate-sugar epimerase
MDLSSISVGWTIVTGKGVRNGHFGDKRQWLHRSKGGREISGQRSQRGCHVTVPQMISLDTSDKVETVSGDIRVFSDVMRTVTDYGIDRIIHVAYALTAEGETNPLLAIQVNCLGTCNVFEGAGLYGVKRGIFSSSIAAYAPPECYGELAVTEDEDLIKPVSTCGATKILKMK